MKRQSLLFLKPDTNVFGSSRDSLSSDRYPSMTWEISPVGIRLTLDRLIENELMRQVETIPWGNVARYTVIEPVEKPKSKARE